jgi:tetratricopeptide (TPR) repeat protein
MNLRELQCVSLLGLCVAGAVCARADTVITRHGLTYADVRIKGVRDYAVVAVASGRETRWPLADIRFLKLTRRESLNHAEDLAREERWAESIEAYQRAARESREPWMRRLCEIRRLQAMEASGRMGSAVIQWLDIVGRGAISPSALALRPSAMVGVASPSPDDDRAIEALERRLEGMKESPALSRIFLGLLMDLHRLGGDKKKAMESASRLVKLANGSVEGDAVASDLLAAGEVLLEGGRYSEALDPAQVVLRGTDDRSYPRALILRAAARRGLARSMEGAERQTLMLRAGLDLMRTFVEWPDDPLAPVALLETARLHEELNEPNLSAAQAAYAEVVKRFPGTPSARDARAALEKAETGL